LHTYGARREAEFTGKHGCCLPMKSKYLKPEHH
jgi:hypothetical protein